MKNRIQFKRAILLSVVVIISFTVFLILATKYQFKAYTSNFNKKINMIYSKINEEYPDVDKSEIVNIFNSNSEQSNNYLLKEYGIDLDKDSIILDNENILKKSIFMNVIICIALSISVVLIFVICDYLKNKKLIEITGYIEEINKKNYKLDISDNTEDELSILKNEIYKTTIMLKESAENSMQDKINLKNSLSDISHQLKTPLTSINIMLDNLLENKDMESKIREDFIKDIKREITNINFLIIALLKLSKFDSNTVTFINQEVKLNDIINKSIKNVSMLCDLKNIKIDVNGNMDININCDFKWQVEAVTNVLKNCIEYSNDNSKIDIIYSENKLYSTIEVKDYGVGISKEEITHVFERFYKGKNSSSDSIGIGLALAKAIIENNGGNISVESKLNEGTKFIIKYFK